MTATNSTALTVLVDIDISKHRHEVLIGILGKTRRRRLTIMTTFEDFQRLSAALATYDLPVRIGSEATGNYHRPIFGACESFKPNTRGVLKSPDTSL